MAELSEKVARTKLSRVVKAQWLVDELVEAERAFAAWPEIKRHGFAQRAAAEAEEQKP